MQDKAIIPKEAQLAFGAKFVVQESALVMVWPGKRVDEKLAKQIKNAFSFGVQRTQEQDVEFPLSQLVEIAVPPFRAGIFASDYKGNQLIWHQRYSSLTLVVNNNSFGQGVRDQAAWVGG